MEKEEAKKIALESAIKVTGIHPATIPDLSSFIGLAEAIYKWLIK
jgi:hypothetical protein